MPEPTAPESIGGKGTIALPADLERAIGGVLATVPAARWMGEAQALSERYRGPRSDAARPLATGEGEALGYLALIFPATYAQLRGAMAATAARCPDWAPTTMLDLGSGPGTALWAATAQWPSLRSLTAWEREKALIGVGQKLARAGNAPALRNAQWERYDFARSQPPTADHYDLVVLGHVLNELEPALQREVVEMAWQRTAGLLLIVEPGTTAAFAVVRTSRDLLLEAGAHTLAPCPHDRSCPLVDDWCHFPQRIVRPDFQRKARGAPSQWEDSKFSYAAMASFGPTDRPWARVIREPSSNKAYAEVKLSTANGVGRYRALKRHRDAFREVRDLRWGAALPEPLPDPINAVDHDHATDRERS